MVLINPRNDGNMCITKLKKSLAGQGFRRIYYEHKNRKPNRRNEETNHWG